MPKGLLKATRKVVEEPKPSAAESLFDNDETEDLKAKAPVKPKATKKSFAQDDKIKCHSVTVGGLFVEGTRSKILYRFTEYGDEQELEYRDLAAMINSRSSYLMTPNFIVDDPDFVAEFPQLNKLYSETYGAQDLLELFELPVDDMIKRVKALPSSAIDNLKQLAATQVATGSLDSVRKIKALDELWGTDLTLASELVQD